MQPVSRYEPRAVVSQAKKEGSMPRSLNRCTRQIDRAKTRRRRLNEVKSVKAAQAVLLFTNSVNPNQTHTATELSCQCAV